MHGIEKTLAWAAAIVSATAFAAPIATVTQAERDDSTGITTVEYTLSGGPAVVTMDVTTNGVSIGGTHMRRLGGDVGVKVWPGAGKKITWIPDSGLDGFKLDDASVKVVVTAWPTNNLPDYMVVDLSMTNSYRFYQYEGQLPYGVTNHMYKTGQLVMRKIPAAGSRFRMGSPADEVGRVADDEAAHYVSFTNDFYLGIYELTKGQLRTIFAADAAGKANAEVLEFLPEYDEYPHEGMGYNYLRGSTAGWPGTPRGAGGSTWPAGKISAISGLVFDFPFDAEWEFACRAGEGAARYDGTNDDSTLDDLAWYAGNAENSFHPVGLKKPNGWGLYDMYGNAREWTHSFYQRYDAGSEQVDPVGWTGKNASGYNSDQDGGYNRISRGGYYADSANECRSAFRQKTGVNTTVGMGLRLWCKAAIP